ncbi:von Willebrand factor D and EGF domain-containing protein [Elysia marginata]|uniref:von Willebrand factor D and EGF domain-containing protein n=1 Tax=Elysia marginata TaxID=1093978 RepID=A0AAV4JPF7_9GAST|nr:von Willebrand factor D and EGF domain-containing protein [Elysia marginata]
MELAAQVNLEGLCDGVELPPPPICPELPEKSRVCYMGNAFTCLFKFSINILQGDSLIWRQQCMTIQKMMSCVARSTSGCKESDEEVKSIRRLLKEFVTKAGDHCPWLTENLCTEQPACPVTKAGCEVDLEYGLITRKADVCTLERSATECVKTNTDTCTKAQRTQAMNVMKKKLKAAGLPGDLMCEGGSIDGHLYSFLAASGDVSVSSRKNATCQTYSSLYNSVNTQFSNPQGKDAFTLAKSLVDQLYAERNLECDGRTSGECAVNFPVKGFATLITDLMVKEEFNLVSFCSQGRALMMMNKTSSCNSQMFDLLYTSYASKCLDEVASCPEVEEKIVRCIASFGDFSSLSCSDQQKAAACVSTNLPSHCSYNNDWLNATALCSDVVVLQATHSKRSKQFVCESGLQGYFGWKRVAGSANFSITIDPVAADVDAVPKCLKGPNEMDPIPQLFYTSARTQEPNQDKVTFKVYGREDYKKDGPQAVDVSFTVNAGSETFELPTTTVYVNDRNIPNSVCSSINDPHLRTYDNIKYNNMATGVFILFRHTMYAEAVVVQYSQCAKYGSCNCGVKVYAGKSMVTFDLCDPSTDLLSYYAEAGADALNQQRMAVMIGKDLKTYSVILLDSGTLVKVRIEGKYMNVWVTPSAKDIGATQGLCGVFDGDGYNDFQLPDFSQYKMKVSDGSEGELAPTDFNNQWKLTKSQADDYTQVFVPNVTISTDPVPTYCHTWTPRKGGKSITKCGKWANLAICGLVNGDDQTASLLANFKQTSSNTVTTIRRKRQAANPVEEDAVSTPVQIPTWPTQSGWTVEQATAWCLDNIPDDTLQKCTQAIASLNGTLESFELDEQVQDCIGDIKASDGTEWLEGARVSAYEHCISELNQNPSYQNNAESSNLAIQFLDSTCTPPDCSGHGTCSTGVCDCYDGYYGTRCDISSEDLTPPVLKEPEDGVHMCEVDSNSDCSSVFISGSNFISSSKLSCHLKEVEVTEIGLREVPGAKAQVVHAQLIATDRVRCDLGERSAWKRSLRVSVSNDGLTPHSQYQLFVAYDPVCFTCDLTTCTRQTGVCVIGNTCVQPGVSSIYDDCEYCDLANPTQWTIRKDLDHCKDKLADSDDSEAHLVPLIGAGCALLALLIIAIIGLLIFLKRRDSRKRSERQARYGQSNPMYEGEQPPPFDGSPVLRVNVRADPSGKQLTPDHFQQDA